MSFRRTAIRTCPFKPVGEKSALTSIPPAAPTNACVQECMLFITFPGENGAVTGNCALTLAGAALMNVEHRIAAMQEANAVEPTSTDASPKPPN